MMYNQEFAAKHKQALKAVRFMISKAKALHTENDKHESWQFRGNMPWYTVEFLENAAQDAAKKMTRTLVFQWVTELKKIHTVCVSYPNQYKPCFVQMAYEVDSLTDEEFAEYQNKLAA